MGNLHIDDALLMAYVDGELDPTARDRIEEALDKDESLRQRVVMFRRSHELLREAFAETPSMAVPPALAGILEKDAGIARSRRAAHSWLMLPALAALLGALFFASPALRSPSASDVAATRVAHVLEEVGEYHSVFARETDHLVELPATRRAEIESWLGERVGLAFKVPDLTARKLSFAGARMLVVDGQPIAQLMYIGPQDERVALCVAAGPNDAPTPLQQGESEGWQRFAFAQAGHIFVVIGPSGTPGLEAIAVQLPQLLTRS